MPRPHVTRPRLRLPRLAGRAVLVTLLAVAMFGGGSYAVARETTVFAVRTIDVRGVTGADAAAVRKALGSLVGESLVKVDAGDAVARVRSLPIVRNATVDRAFPSTLRVDVQAERPVAVMREGKGAWLVSARLRILEAVSPGEARLLPRVWLPTAAGLLVPGRELTTAQGAAAVRALAHVGESFPLRVRSARAGADGVVLVLAGGLELRLGEAGEIPLKLAAAKAVLEALPRDERAGLAYLDAATPGRVVAGAKSQVSS